jgi:hypothetical protein
MAEEVGVARVREVPWEERIRWGVCPVCEATDGEPCHAEVGAHLGMKASGARLKTGEGVHLARLERAPMRVREVPA